MKVRNGFVSNSSSSSFVVAFEKKPTIEELTKMLYGDAEVIPDEYRTDIVYSPEYLAETIHNRMFGDPENEITTIEQFVEAIEGFEPNEADLELEGVEEYSEQWFTITDARRDKEREEEEALFAEVNVILYDRTGKYTDEEKKAAEKRRWEIYDQKWERENEINRKVARVEGERFFQEHPNASIWKVEIGDDNSLGSHLEHGGTFSKLPHYRISHH
jgi:hypothetical protein